MSVPTDGQGVVVFEGWEINALTVPVSREVKERTLKLPLGWALALAQATHCMPSCIHISRGTRATLATTGGWNRGQSGLW